MKGINHILSGKVIKDTKRDNILEPIPQISIQSYCEVLKFNSFVFSFGGVDQNTGDISDSVIVINLLDFNYRKELKLPKRLFAFSLSVSPSRGNYLLIGGLTCFDDSNNIAKNDSIYEISIKENSNSIHLNRFNILSGNRETVL